MELGLSISEVSEWLSTATDFKNKYADFNARAATLRDTPVDPVKYPILAKEKADLLAKADSINSKVKSTVNAIDSAYSQVKYYASHPGELIQAPVAVVTTGAKAIFDWGKSALGLDGLNGLGVLPVLIPVAVIGTAAAAIVYWIKDADTLSKKLAEQKRLESQGIPAEKAAEIVQKTFGSPGLFGNVKTVAYVGLGALALYILYQQFGKK